MKTILFAAVLLSFSLPVYAKEPVAATPTPAAASTVEKSKPGDDCLSGKKPHDALCQKSGGKHLGVDKKLKPITLHKKKDTLKPLF